MADASSYPRGSQGDGDGRPTLWERLMRWRGLTVTDHAQAIEELIGETPEGADRNERTLLENVLKLRRLTAWDVMVPRVDIVAVDVETPFPDLVKILVEESHSRLPVYRDDLDHVIGMVHVKDVLAFVAAKRVATLPKLLRKVLFVAPSTGVLDLLSQMRLSRTHMALVVDEFGGIDGLITIEDLVEEIVGEIEDEYDVADPPNLLERPDGSLIADARTPIEELENRLEIKLLEPDAEEDVDTLGGLIFMLAGRVPGKGETIEHPGGIFFDVLEADPRRVRRLRVRRPARPAETEADAS